jgi:hypothetical protein
MMRRVSSQETKAAAKFGKFGSKKPSAKFAVPKLNKAKEDEAPAVSVDDKPEPKSRRSKAGNGVNVDVDKAEPGDADRTDPVEQHTEELPEDELLDEDDLEEIDGELLDDDFDEPVIKAPSVAASGSIDAPDNATIEMTPQERPVDPYAATQAIGSDDVAALRAHKEAAEASLVGVVAGELGGDLPGISGDPLAAAAPVRPVTSEEAEAAAAVAALDGLDDNTFAVESSIAAAAPAPVALTNTSSSGSYPAQSMPPGPSSSGPYPAQPMPPGPSSTGPFPAVHTPYPGYSPTPLPQQSPVYNPTPFPQQAPQMYTPTPLPQQAPPPDPMAVEPRPGTMEAARQASWKQAHPSARRWAKRRDAHTGRANRRTPQPLRIGAGLLLIGVGIYLLAIFIPAHSPDGPREAERTEVGKIWRFNATQHTVMSGLAFGFVGLGLFAMVGGALYRREIIADCNSCKMKVEVTRSGLSLRCQNGGHKAGLDKSAVALLALFLVVGSSAIALLVTASLG